MSERDPGPGPMFLTINPKRLAELKAMPRCQVCRSLVKVCGGCLDKFK